MIPVYLNPSDQIWAQDVGHRRWVSSQKKRSKPRMADATERDHHDGAGGELAFCRALGLTWPGHVDVYKVPDVFPSWEVRVLRKIKAVPVHPDDPDDWLVAWVAGALPRYEVMGYIRAGGAKRHPEWLRDPGKRKAPAYFVPPERMIPIDPGFHSVCGWSRDDWGLWHCAFCGARYVGP